ncbi:MAG TPA: outer membrane protein assembly factor BamA [Mariprofundaceae bacterium]|nr:outer membrane protein assembly factor BamA [Mariprofundaceae bacterium]
MCTLAPHVWGQESGTTAQKRIASIAVQGNHYIESGVVLENIHTRVGDVLDRAKISRDVKRLFKTGYFSDIHVVGEHKPDGEHLTFVVKEHPLIASVNIEGNNAVTKKDLKFKLRLKAGQVLNPTVLDKDIDTIRKGYLKKGYYQMYIDVVKKPRKDGRIDLTLKVHEGEITHIKRIRFIGNKGFSDADLRGKIASRQSDLISWFTDRDVFDRSRLKADAQLIQQTYMNAGYLDAKIDSSIVALSSDKLWFYLTFSIHEGPKYRVSSVDIQGDMVPDRETLEKLVTLHSGDLYSLEELQKTVEDLTTRVGDEGYAFANVTPMFHRHLDNHTVDITLDIEKGRQVYVERIEVTGNDKTNDSVVRRAMRQDEGGRFSSSRLALSKEKLNKLQLFKDVRISMPKGSAPDKVKMKVGVTPKKTGQFSIGAGFSQLQKAFIRSSLSEGNLFGKGLQGSINGEIGVRTQNFNASLTDPYFLDKNMSASINIFKQQTRLNTFTSYKYNNYGLGTNFGIPLTEHLTYGIGYNFKRSNLFGLPANASLYLKSQSGKQTTSEVTNSLTWDTRDSVMRPTKGYHMSGSVGVAGLGGLNHFYTFSGNASAFFSLNEDFILSPKIQASYIHGFGGKQVPIYRRFSLGGIGSLRGFNYYGVTVRDPATGQVIGGNKMASGSLNLFFPIPYVHTTGFRGVAFIDAGNVGGLNEKMTFGTVRAATGLGIQWLSPMGPLSLVWAKPIRTQPGDQKRTFQFALGSSF